MFGGFEVRCADLMEPVSDAGERALTGAAPELREPVPGGGRR